MSKKWLIYLYDKADESNKVTVMFNTRICIPLQQPNTEMALIYKYYTMKKVVCLLPTRMMQFMINISHVGRLRLPRTHSPTKGCLKGQSMKNHQWPCVSGPTFFNFPSICICSHDPLRLFMDCPFKLIILYLYMIQLYNIE